MYIYIYIYVYIYILYIYIYIHIYIYLFIKFASRLALQMRLAFRGLPCFEKCRYLLHMAARAWPAAANGSKWLLEPAPEPQMARNCSNCSKLLLEPERETLMARNGCPEPQMARNRPAAADGSKWLLEPAPEPQLARNCRSSPLRSRK